MRILHNLPLVVPDEAREERRQIDTKTEDASNQGTSKLKVEGFGLFGRVLMIAWANLFSFLHSNPIGWVLQMEHTRPSSNEFSRASKPITELPNTTESLYNLNINRF